MTDVCWICLASLRKNVNNQRTSVFDELTGVRGDPSRFSPNPKKQQPAGEHPAAHRRLGDGGHAASRLGDSTCSAEGAALRGDVGIDELGVVVDVHFSIVVKVAVAPAARIVGDAVVDADVVV